MNTNTHIFENGQRLRYEALSVFATELNKCLDYKAVCDVLSSQIKFILNAFVFRVYYRHGATEISCEVFMGECDIRKGAGTMLAFEDQAIKRELPLNYTQEQIKDSPLFWGTVFNHEKIVSVLTLPVAYTEDHMISVTVASKEANTLVEVDFRFLKLLSELLSNKLFQLKLLQDISVQNQELELKNLQITRFNQTLSETVVERTRELTEANEDLTTLFYKTSHDFRAPLANIMGLANLASVSVNDPDAMLLFEKCRTVASGMDNMLTKIDALTRRFESRPQSVNFEQLVASFRQKYDRRLKACNGTIKLICYEVLDYKCDAEILNIVFDNLIDNSIAFNNGNLQLDIHITMDDNNLCIGFTDNGQGIDSACLPHIFEMYFRGSANTTGHGLGLYIIKKLLKILKGEITVSSILNKSTSVLIKLPV